MPRIVKTFEDKLTTIDSVRDHLQQFRDDLQRCCIGFSGGKDSVALAKLVHEINPDVPLIWVYCKDCEWPCHVDFMQQFHPTMLDSGHDWDWFRGNLWAFHRKGSRDKEKWMKLHQRGILRRYAKTHRLTLLWGNRCADRNTVPSVRYLTREAVDLWCPLRDLSSDDTLSLLTDSDMSPVYRLSSMRGSGEIPISIKTTPEDRYSDVQGSLAGSAFWPVYQELFRLRFGEIGCY